MAKEDQHTTGGRPGTYALQQHPGLHFTILPSERENRTFLVPVEQEGKFGTFSEQRGLFGLHPTDKKFASAAGLLYDGNGLPTYFRRRPRRTDSPNVP